jgi:hypothetical protein
MGSFLSALEVMAGFGKLHGVLDLADGAAYMTSTLGALQSGKPPCRAHF